MPSFGIIVLNQDQEQTYYRDIGIAASRFGIAVHRFVPSSIDPYTEKVNGETFDANENRWHPETFQIPDILYDRCFYTTWEAYKTNAPVVEWLKNRATFLGFGLPNKSKVYETLKNDPYLSNYTIETVKAGRSETIMKALNRRKTVLLKPETGSQGKGIFVVKKTANKIVVKTDRRGKTVQKSFSDASALRKWLDIQLFRTTFLIQPFLTLQNKRKQPFDIRVVMQKDGHGHWTESGRGVRIGKPGALVSNLHSTGKIVDFDQWLGSRPVKYRGFIVDEVEGIIERVPPLLEKTFGPLFELGLDIGIDTNGAVWILEANSKPGHQTVLEGGRVSREQLAEAPLKYARLLLKDKDEGVEIYATAANPSKN